MLKIIGYLTVSPISFSSLKCNSGFFISLSHGDDVIAGLREGLLRSLRPPAARSSACDGAAASPLRHAAHPPNCTAPAHAPAVSYKAISLRETKPSKVFNCNLNLREIFAVNANTLYGQNDWDASF